MGRQSSVQKRQKKHCLDPQNPQKDPHLEIIFYSPEKNGLCHSLSELLFSEGFHCINPFMLSKAGKAVCVKLMQRWTVVGILQLVKVLPTHCDIFSVLLQYYGLRLRMLWFKMVSCMKTQINYGVESVSVFSINLQLQLCWTESEFDSRSTLDYRIVLHV